MTGERPIRRALISVYDKTGLVDLATGLHSADVSIVSTGSTAATIAQAGIPVTPVEELTGFPEVLDGRVKTLHPRVHAGVLADSRIPSHLETLREHGIEPFDLVIVNLYPFTDTVASGASFDECVEQIDIGGPSMVRAAAKNHPSVGVVVDPSRYAEVLEAACADGTSVEQRRAWAADAFAHTAAYDAAVATWFADQLSTPEQAADYFGVSAVKTADLRYGENPHQKAAVYSSPAGGGVAAAQQLGGKEMSYNNYQDIDAAVRAAYDFTQPAVAIIKHANPCGIAVGETAAQAHAKAHECDPVSAYGGVIATNRTVDLSLAESIRPIFTEVLAAPDFDDDALALLREKKKKLRLLKLGDWKADAQEFKQISGGVLVQDRDVFQAQGDDPENWTLATGEAASPEVLADLEFAWKASRAVKSNAILLASSGASVGVGMGQVNRVDSAHLAVERAGAERAQGAVAASDAFFPFADGLEVLIKAGVTAVVQPGGSVNDPEVIEAAQAAGLTMYMTGTRHFFH